MCGLGSLCQASVLGSNSTIWGGICWSTGKLQVWDFSILYNPKQPLYLGRVFNITLKKTSLPEQVLQVLDVLDGQPERLNLGESFARRLEEGESLPQLRGTVHQLNRQKARLSQGWRIVIKGCCTNLLEGLVHVLHPGTLPVAGRPLVLLSLAFVLEPFGFVFIWNFFSSVFLL